MRPQTRARTWVVLLLALAGLNAGKDDARLVDAVKARDAEAVRTLLKKGADPNTPQGDGATALHWAVYWADRATVDSLIRAGAKVNAVNDLGATALWVAASAGNSAMVDTLLKAGANPNAALETGETPLMAAVRTGDVESVKALLKRGARHDVKGNTRGQTPLMWAAANGHPAVVKALVDAGADVRARSVVFDRLVNTGRWGMMDKLYDPRVLEVRAQGGFTPLLFAVQQGDIESAKILLAAGADANDAGPDGTSALVLAAHSDQAAVANVLLELHANPNAAGSGYTALQAAVLRGNQGLVQRLLTHGADPNARLTKGTVMRRYGEDYVLHADLIGATPFWLAARFGEVEIMRMLVAAGADAQTAIPDGTTPIMAVITTTRTDGDRFRTDRRDRYKFNRLEFDAIDNDSEMRRSLDVIELALSLGSDVNAAGPAGDTALHSAAAGHFDPIVKLLAAHGANVNAKNTAGKTPLALVSKPSRQAVAAANNDPSPNTDGTSTAALLRSLGATE